MKTERHLQSTSPPMHRVESIRSKGGVRVKSVLLVASAAILMIVSYRLYYMLVDSLGSGGAFLVAIVLAAGSIVAVQKGLNRQAISTFLLSVESEAAKIAWLTWPELKQSTLVVLGCMIAFSLYLFCCDITWQLLLNSLSILKLTG